eukprot:TRINITY_DN7133_c1_g1_i2.p1 TRINITY_DN7133_c1_g1~~TRINITY_DN7133_c1_g1_i2.p1  ORF type:complete len:147 (-),score=37.37 TRINITY_DN7133_c1_g1_i2:33-473(-)
MAFFYNITHFALFLLFCSIVSSQNVFLMSGYGGDNAGYSVSGGGDVNGDGISDVGIGAPLADSNGNVDNGQIYVIFGKNSSGFPSSFDFKSLNGSDGFIINGVASGDQSGWSVSIGGDVNNDGIADIMIGAPFATSNSTYWQDKVI